VLVTGRRWGKTTLAVNHLAAAALLYPGAYYYVAPYYHQAKTIAWKMFLKYIPKELIKKTNETALSLLLTTGSEICLKGADNPDSLRGVGLNMVVLDEYSQMKEEVWQEIIRPMLADTGGKALFIGTPKGKNQFWELWRKGQKEEEGFKSWSYPTSDNPVIDPQEIADAKSSLNERYFRQEWEASFEDYTGLIWPEFMAKEHIIAPIIIPAYWERVGAIDPAATGTTASLIAVAGDQGEIYIIEEYYQQNVRVSEVSQGIKDKAKRWFIDPASKIKNIPRMGDLYSLYDEYGDNGIYPIVAENDVEAGINRVAEYFKQGKLKIFSTCKNLIFELERYHWADERETVFGMMKPKPFKSLDHACDCLRYLIMSRPQIGKPEQRTAPRHSVAWYLDQEEVKAKDWKKGW
jgi:PBSX family phage terminase large subunit